MKFNEKLKYYNKEGIFEIYARVVFDMKDYEKTTKKKMIEAIFKEYSNYNNIIDICTTKELKYLKLLIENNNELEYDNKYSWEIKTLDEKLLISKEINNKIKIPEEFYKTVEEAIKKVKWKEVKEKDKINELAISLCKVYGELLSSIIIEITSELLDIDKETITHHVVNNKLFNYYIYISFKHIPSIDKELPTFIYRDFYQYIDELDESRSQNAISAPHSINIEDYISIFYNDFNLNDRKIKRFYNELMAIDYNDILVDTIKLCILLVNDREDIYYLTEKVYKSQIKDLDKFINLLDYTIDNSPSGALNGLTPNELEQKQQEIEEYEFKRELSYIPQTNASIPEKDVNLFYRLYFALLEYTNNKYKIVPNLKKIYKRKNLNPYDISLIKEKLWEDKENIIDEFIKENPFKLKVSELELVKEFKKGLNDIFIIAKYEPEYTLFLGNNKIYMVKGLHANIDEIIPNEKLPYIVKTSLIPFKGFIVYDGLFNSPSINMGINLKKSVAQDLSNFIKYYHL